MWSKHGRHGQGVTSRCGDSLVLIQAWLWMHDQFLGERHDFTVALCHCNSVCLLSVFLSLCLRPPHPVRRWRSGRVHLAEGSNIVVLELPYSTEFGRESRKFASGVRKYGKFSHFLTHPVVYGGQGKKQILYSLSTANVYRLPFLLRILMYVVRPTFEKNNMTCGSPDFVGQSPPRLAHV